MRFNDDAFLWQSQYWQLFSMIVSFVVKSLPHHNPIISCSFFVLAVIYGLTITAYLFIYINILKQDAQIKSRTPKKMSFFSMKVITISMCLMAVVINAQNNISRIVSSLRPGMLIGS